MSKANYDAIIKVLLIGESGVGKSCILIRYADKTFSPTFITTIGIDFKVKNIEVQERKVKVHLWDTAGQERYRTITTAYYRGAQSICLVYDVTNRQSFENIGKWLKSLESLASKNCKTVLVANKIDCDNDRTVSKEEAEKLAKEYNLPYFEVSAKADIGLEDMFGKICSDVLKTSINEKDREKAKNAMASLKSLQGYKLFDELGSGHNAVTRWACEEKSGMPVAAKVYVQSASDDEVKQEVSALQKLNHPNIVKLLGTYVDPPEGEFRMIVLELASGGELFPFLGVSGRLDEATARILFAQVVQAVKHCHENGMIHGAVGLDNLLLDDWFSVKLCDFAFSVDVNSDGSLPKFPPTKPAGSEPPEVKEGDLSKGFAYDVYCLGVLLLLLVTGKPPVPSSVAQLKEGGSKDLFWKDLKVDLSDSVKELIMGMLQPNNMTRLNLDLVESHPWFGGISPDRSSMLVELERRQKEAEQAERKAEKKNKVLGDARHATKRRGLVVTAEHVEDRWFLEASSNEEKEAAWFLAAALGRVEVLKELHKIRAEAGLDANAMKEGLYMTALDIAAWKGNTEACAFLVETAGLQMDSKDSRRQSSLAFAASTGNEDTARFLITKGAMVDGASGEVVTPAYLACKLGQFELFKLLVLAGADLDRKSQSVGLNSNEAAELNPAEELKLVRSLESPNKIKNAANMLEWLEKEGKVLSEREKTEVNPDDKHVMISYNWGHQKEAIRMKNALVARGFNVWLDIDKMKGSTMQCMAEAVEKAGAVLVCMSPAYQKSPNCRLEGEYVMSLKKPFIPLMMPKGRWKPSAWLGLMLGMKLWYRVQPERDAFKQTMDDLAKVLREHVKQEDKPLVEEPAVAEEPKSDSGGGGGGGMFVAGLKNFGTPECAEWEIDQVCEWLEMLGIKEEYQKNFRDGEMDGAALAALVEMVHINSEYMVVEEYIRELMPKMGPRLKFLYGCMRMERSNTA